jgi:tRNA dimethylallyltransferase
VDHPLVCIVGPTGAGKSSLALRLAPVFSAEIVNCDSLQIYRGFDIGSAKTPLSERRNIPHHLLDVLEADSVYSAGDYARDARAVLLSIRQRGRLPLVVGGTGFYVRALLDGLPELPGREPGLRARLLGREESRPGALHRVLKRLEPSAAARIHSQDTQKVLRALEVRLLTRRSLPGPGTGVPLTGYRVLQIGLAPDRDALVEAIARRTRRMFEEGLVEEVRALLAGGLTGAEKPFEALGYKQVLMHLRGEISLDDAILSAELETRQYAKRQMTWFRRDPRIHWIRGFGSEDAVFEEAATRIRQSAGIQ